jgi:hypothetical protein
VNNNPFEYHMDHEDEAHTQLIASCEEFILNPGGRDITVEECMPAALVGELQAAMEKEGWDGVGQTMALWESDLKSRKIVSGFLADKSIGSKRLTSMPDRISNTINTSNEGAVCRPAVMNQFEGALGTKDAWWSQWKEFMFERELEIKEKGGCATKRVCEMLGKIQRSKYPALTEEEEAISIPLQTLCLAIFDCIILHILSAVAPGSWEGLKQQIVDGLTKKKTARIMQIMQTQYGDTDLVFLQEVAAVFIDSAKESLPQFHVSASKSCRVSRSSAAAVSQQVQYCSDPSILLLA